MWWKKWNLPSPIVQMLSWEYSYQECYNVKNAIDNNQHTKNTLHQTCQIPSFLTPSYIELLFFFFWSLILSTLSLFLFLSNCSFYQILLSFSLLLHLPFSQWTMIWLWQPVWLGYSGLMQPVKKMRLILWFVGLCII